MSLDFYMDSTSEHFSFVDSTLSVRSREEQSRVRSKMVAYKLIVLRAANVYCRTVTLHVLLKSG